MKRNILFLFLCVYMGGVLVSLSAQQSPGIDWKKIESEHFLLIFPSELESDARRVAALAENAYTRNRFEGTRHPYRRWPLVLTNRSMQANGFVDPMGQRSVWFARPFSGMSVEWYHLLAVHEGRHMAQFDRYKRGTLFLAYLFGGNTAVAYGSSVVNPLWFAEGDAVDRETAYSFGGRGRDPLFHRALAAIIDEEDGYSYQKMKSGSFKDFIPDHYRLGYPLVAYGRSRYGEDAWDSYLNGPCFIPLPILGPVIGSLAAFDTTPSGLYRQMVKAWEEEREGVRNKQSYTGNTLLGKESRSHLRYDSLSLLDGHRLAARRSSMDKAPQLVMIEGDREEALSRLPGSASLAVSEKLLITAESVPHPLYKDVGYRDLFISAHDGSDRRRISHHRRYSDICVSRDGKRLLALEFLQDRSMQAVLFRLPGGEVLARFPLPDGVRGFSPALKEDKRSAALLLRGAEGLALAELDLQSGDLSYLLPYGNELIRKPSYHRDSILFSSNYSGENALYQLVPGEGRQLIAKRPYSALEPVADPDTEQLFYIDYRGTEGERLVEGKLPEPGRYPFPPRDTDGYVIDSFAPPADVRTPAETMEPDEQSLSSYEVEPYYPALGLLRPVQWNPVIRSSLPGMEEPVDQLESLGFGLKSQDPLDILQLSLTAEYLLNEESFGTSAQAVLKAFYPRLLLNGSYRYRRPTGDAFHEYKMGGQALFPLYLSRGSWLSGLQLQLGASVLAEAEGDAPPEDTSVPFLYGISLEHLLPGSHRSLSPRWGVKARSVFTHTPLDASSKSIFSFSSELYFPSFVSSHSLILSGGWERQNSSYLSYLPPSKGYSALTGEKRSFLAADYLFPIWYPDIALGPLAFIQRLKGDLFVQSTMLDGEPLSSAGVQLDLDFKLADVPLLLSLGMRASYLIEEGKMTYQITVMGK